MTPERAESDMAKALSEAQENLDKIKALRGKKNSGYMDTVRAFDRATDSLDRAWTYLNHLQSVADSPRAARRFEQAYANRDRLLFVD